MSIDDRWLYAQRMLEKMPRRFDVAGVECQVVFGGEGGAPVHRDGSPVLARPDPELVRAIVLETMGGSVEWQEEPVERLGTVNGYAGVIVAGGIPLRRVGMPPLLRLEHFRWELRPIAANYARIITPPESFPTLAAARADFAEKNPAFQAPPTPKPPVDVWEIVRKGRVREGDEAQFLEDCEDESNLLDSLWCEPEPSDIGKKVKKLRKKHGTVIRRRMPASLTFP